MRHKTETTLAVITMMATLLHFVLETAFHFKWGQPLQALIVDYIWNALAIFAAVLSLKIRPHSAAGFLAASWAYALGFGWRSAFSRLERLATDTPAPNGEPSSLAYIVTGALCFVAVMLVWALFLAWQQTANRL